MAHITASEKTNGCPAIISRTTEATIADLSRSVVIDAFKAHGAIIFKGFEVGVDDMWSFSSSFTSRFNRDRVRQPVEGTDGYVQLVTEGTGYISPHSEQANSPFRPDALWFCCETPVSDGGETLLWDGIQLWGALDDGLKALFRQKRLRYFQKYSRERWLRFLGRPDATVDDALASLKGIPNLTYYVSPDKDLYIEYLSSAMAKTKFSNTEAFANALLSERDNTLGNLMTFEDGAPVTDAIVKEIRGLIEQYVVPIKWEKGDLAFIDNSRVMHGRNAYSDRRRRILSSMSFINF